MTPKNQVLEVVCRNDKAVEVDLNGAPILQVGINSSTGLASTLQFNNSTVNLEQSDKPQVETLNGQTVVGSVAPSLSKVTFPSGKMDQFHFTVDSKVQPQLAITSTGASARTFGWNSANGLITQDDDWIYQITPSPNGQMAAFSRKSASGRSESWLNDPASGQEVTETDGIKRTTSRFASGKFSGIIRKITETIGGKEKIVYSADYDELGRSIRVFDKGKTKSYVYNDANSTVAVYCESQLICTGTFDAQHRLISAVNSNGFKRAITYLPDGSSKESDTFPDGRVVSR